MNLRRILDACDHTLLKQTAGWCDVREVIDDGVRYRTASVCIPPCFVRQAQEYLDGCGEALPVCTVIGFPNGTQSVEAKVFEARDAAENGASELDMVLNIGRLKAGETDAVLAEIRDVREAVPDRVLKVIIETCLLSDAEKIAACQIVTDSGADFIKTSTGFSTGGATLEDVRLLRANVGAHVKVKASGGIATLDDAGRFLDAGADRLGTSRIVKLIKEREAR